MSRPFEELGNFSSLYQTISALPTIHLEAEGCAVTVTAVSMFCFRGTRSTPSALHSSEIVSNCLSGEPTDPEPRRTTHQISFCVTAAAADSKQGDCPLHALASICEAKNVFQNCQVGKKIQICEIKTVTAQLFRCTGVTFDPIPRRASLSLPPQFQRFASSADKLGSDAQTPDFPAA
jgi:hypothetical protein